MNCYFAGESKDAPTETNELSNGLQRHNSMLRSRHQKSNSVFYTKVNPPDSQSSQKRGFYLFIFLIDIFDLLKCQ